MNRNLLNWGGLAIAGTVLVAVNLVSTQVFRGARIDLTEGRIYTLSDGSRNIVKKIDEPIKLRLFYSRKVAQGIPQIQTYATRVQDMLREMAAMSGGKLVVETIEPEPFSEAEDEAAIAGLNPIPINAAGDQLFFGLVGSNTIDQTEVLPFFNPQREQFLEYDIASLVSKLNTPDKTVVGVMSKLPMAGAAPDNPMDRNVEKPWIIYEQLNEIFETQTVDPAATEIPAGIDVLMVVHPKDLSDNTLYAIDQFVLRGGRLLAFVDPHAERDPGENDPRNPYAAMFSPKKSNMDRLFKAWGVEYSPDNFVGDRANALTMTFRDNRGLPTPVQYVGYFSLEPGEGQNAKDVVSANLGNTINMGTVGELKAAAGATTEFIPLLTTSNDSMLIATSEVQFQPDPKKMLENFKPLDRSITVAARVTGKVKTAFPEGPPAPPPPDAGGTPPGMPPGMMEFPGGGQDIGGEAPPSAEGSGEASPPASEGTMGTEGAAAAPAEEVPVAEATSAEASPDAAPSDASVPNVLTVPESTPATGNQLTESKDPINVIIVADTDVLVDDFWSQSQQFGRQRLVIPMAANADFVFNAVENLSGSADLATIRAKKTAARPFTKIEELAKKAGERLQARQAELEKKLEEKQTELNQLVEKAGTSGSGVSAGDLAKLQEDVRKEVVETRRELREVNRELRSDIERLETKLRLINIGLIPALATVLAVVLGIIRVKRRRSAA